MARYEVIVGNVGTVPVGNELSEAESVFDDYVKMSAAEIGRAAGEDVVLMEDGEPIKEYFAARLFDVLVKPRVMVRIDGIRATSQEEAAKKAVELWEEHGRDLDNVTIQLRIPGLRYVDFAEDEDIFEVMVDVQGDDDYHETHWYLVAMSEPEAIVQDSNWMNRKFHDLILEEQKKQKELS